jgi:hypothetical protein
MKLNTFIACLCLTASASVAGHAVADSLRTVAFTGDAAPGVGAGTTFVGFGAPALNSRGETAFQAAYSDGEVGIGIWSENGVLGLVTRQGSQAPDTPAGTTFASISHPRISNLGYATFFAVLGGAGVTDRNAFGLWSERIGALSLVVRDGSQAPGTPESAVFAGGFTLSHGDRLVVNNAGQAAFINELRPSQGVMIREISRGLWSEGTGALALVARTGLPVPGTSDGLAFAELSSRSMRRPVLNDMGKTAFTSGLLRGVAGVTDANDGGVWAERGGSLALVAREGSQAPMRPAGESFSVFGDVRINNKGQIAFSASLLSSPGSSPDPLFNRGIWSEGSGQLMEVAHVRSEAPGASGATFSGFENPVINRAGRTAFCAYLANPSLIGLWSEGRGELALVALAGAQAPGAAEGTTFDNFPTNEFTHSLNAAGQAAFIAVVTDSQGVRGEGIWAQDSHGTLQLIALTGNKLDIDDGPGVDWRTISGLDSRLYDPFSKTGNEDGHVSTFNDLGQVAFTAYFTDGTSGVFVSNLVAIPEPTAKSLVGACVACLWFRRRRMGR